MTRGADILGGATAAWAPVWKLFEPEGSNAAYLCLADYEGGRGTKPTVGVGKLIGSNGYVDDPADAVNLRAFSQSIISRLLIDEGFVTHFNLGVKRTTLGEVSVLTSASNSFVELNAAGWASHDFLSIVSQEPNSMPPLRFSTGLFDRRILVDATSVAVNPLGYVPSGSESVAIPMGIRNISLLRHSTDEANKLWGSFDRFVLPSNVKVYGYSVAGDAGDAVPSAETGADNPVTGVAYANNVLTFTFEDNTTYRADLSALANSMTAIRDQVSAEEKLAGTGTDIKDYAPQDVHDMIDYHGGAAPWLATVTYEAGRIVTHSDKVWRCVTGGLNSEPADDNANWAEIGARGPAGPQGETGQRGEAGARGDQGPRGDMGDQGPRGDPGTQGPQGETGPAGSDATDIGGRPWNSGTTYTAGVIVTHDNKTWRSLTASTNSEPTEGTHWTEIGAQGPAGPQGNTGPQGEPGQVGGTAADVGGRAWDANHNYGANVIVGHANQLWRSTEANNNSEPSASNTNWQQWYRGTYIGLWVSGNTYQLGQYVYYYVSLTPTGVPNPTGIYLSTAGANTTTPGAANANWHRMDQDNIVWRGAWSRHGVYNSGDVVTHEIGGTTMLFLTPVGTGYGLTDAVEPTIVSTSTWIRTDSPVPGDIAWSSLIAYPTNALVTHANKVWRAILGGGNINQNVVPSAENSATWAEIGAQGPAGPQGDAGPRGDQGPRGDTGPQGNTGTQGPQGTQGVQGPQGIQGTAGTAGAAGAAGADAGAWLNNVAYDPGAIVSHTHRTWFARIATTAGHEPGVSDRWRPADVGGRAYHGRARYEAQDLAIHGGRGWRAVQVTSGSTPADDNNNWSEFARDRWRGAWVSTGEYRAGDFASHSSHIWIAVADTGQGNAVAVEPGTEGGAGTWTQMTESVIAVVLDLTTALIRNNTTPALYAPKAVIDAIEHFAPDLDDTDMDSTPTATKGQVSGEQIHAGAKAAIPAATVAGLTGGLGTDVLSMSEAVFKDSVEALIPEGGTEGESTQSRTLLGTTTTESTNKSVILNAASWQDYTYLQLVSAESGATKTTGLIPVRSLKNRLAISSTRALVGVGGLHGVGFAVANESRMNRADLNARSLTTATLNAGWDDDAADPDTLFLQSDNNTWVIGFEIEVWGVELKPAAVEGELLGTTRFAAQTSGTTIHLLVNAADWGNYNDIRIVMDDSDQMAGQDDIDELASENYRIYPPMRMPTAVLRTLSVRQRNAGGEAVAGPLLKFDNTWLSGTNETDVNIIRTNNADDTTTTAASGDHLQLQFDTRNVNGRVRVYGVNSPSATTMVNAAAPFVTYGHRNCPSPQGFYPRFTVYPAADYAAGYRNLSNDRPFQVEGINASSNDGNGLPSSAGLTWKTGALAGMDTGAFPGGAPSALPAGTAFSLDGTWKIRVNVNVDGMRKTGMRMHIIIKKVNSAADNDDTAFYAESAEAAGGGHEGERPGVSDTAALPTNIIHDFATTAEIETPWTVFDPDDVYYVLWGFIVDDEAPRLWRLSQAFIEFQKRGS